MSRCRALASRCCVLLVVLAAGARPAAATDRSLGGQISGRDLQRITRSVVAQSGTPGLTVRLVEPGDFLAAAAGKRQRGAAPAFRVEDPVHIGSCLKAMTATLAGRLVDRGVVRWETTIGEAFPDLAPALAPAVATVRLEELLAHRSGLTDDVPDELLAAVLAFHGSGRAARQRFLPAYLALGAGGVRGAFAYSNLGYAVAGAMLEQATDRSYQDLVWSEVFRPLGIRSAVFAPPGSNDPTVIDAPRGHDPSGRPLLPAQQLNPPILEPAGMASMTLRDWSRFAISQMGLPVNGTLLLSPESLERIQTPVGGPLPDGSGYYALGWIVFEGNGRTLLAHDGSNEAWISRILLDRENRRALLVATNEWSPRAEAAVQGVTLAPRILGWFFAP